MTRKIWITGIAAVLLTAAVCMGIVLFTAFSVPAVTETETVEESEMATETQGEQSAENGRTESAVLETEQESVEQTGETDSREAGSNAVSGSLAVDTDPLMYTYDQMVQDLKYMESQHPELVELESIADTPDGREIWHLIIGSRSADRHVLVTASIHAREYLTTQLVMKQASEFLKRAEEAQPVLEHTAIHVVPMINPDGVSISQLGLDGCNLEETRNRVLEIGEMDGALDWNSYLRRWKSNAQGVDLNRNFDALWEQYNDGLGRPSADHYKGTAAGCTPEAAALIRLTEEYPFARTISYHTQGGVIYWYFGQSGDLKTDTEAFAKRVSEVTGYPMDANYEKLDPAGYKDWAIYRKGIPSLTIEVGHETSPVPPAQFPAIWQANRSVWDVMLEQ